MTTWRAADKNSIGKAHVKHPSTFRVLVIFFPLFNKGITSGFRVRFSFGTILPLSLFFFKTFNFRFRSPTVYAQPRGEQPAVSKWSTAVPRHGSNGTVVLSPRSAKVFCVLTSRLFYIPDNLQLDACCIPVLAVQTWSSYLQVNHVESKSSIQENHFLTAVINKLLFNKLLKF